MRKKFTTEQITEIVQLRVGGMKFREIKSRFNVSASRINSWAKSLGVSFKNTFAQTRRKTTAASHPRRGNGIPSPTFREILKNKSTDETLHSAMNRWYETGSVRP